eukprot:GHVQ01021069.1.p1 GENE.GHVQ01021069.1~~GHVQ01021069.1.p1  ORF type:complete len:223 (-),score=19.54 GHVQ01021069.1:89-757(-)
MTQTTSSSLCSPLLKCYVVNVPYYSHRPRLSTSSLSNIDRHHLSNPCITYSTTSTQLHMSIRNHPNWKYRLSDDESIRKNQKKRQDKIAKALDERVSRNENWFRNRKAKFAYFDKNKYRILNQHNKFLFSFPSRRITSEVPSPSQSAGNYYGADRIVLVKKQTPYNVMHPFIRQNDWSKRRKNRMRGRPEDPMYFCKTRKERNIMNTRKRWDRLCARALTAT